MPKDNKLNKDILNQIDKTDPKSKNYFLGKNILLGALLVAFGFVSVFILASFIIDAREILVFSDRLSFVDIFNQLLFELVLIVLVISGLFYLLYRQTDWILVRHKVWLVLTFSVLVISFSGLSLMAFQEAAFDSPRDTLKVLPHRQKRAQKLNEKLLDNGSFVGKIVYIDTQNREIKIENPIKSVFFRLGESVNTEELVLGKDVIVRFQEIDSELVVSFIKDAPKPPKDLRNNNGKINPERVKEIMKEREQSRKELRNFDRPKDNQPRN
jgi:hypothetical protein